MITSLHEDDDITRGQIEASSHHKYPTQVNYIKKSRILETACQATLLWPAGNT